MRIPIAHSGANDTWAPSGLGYREGSLYFAGLRSQALFEAKIQPDSTVQLQRHYAREYGRLRGVVVHGTALLFTTSNTDGRGSPKSGDDKIFKIQDRL
jgi:hypothetical protein